MDNAVIRTTNLHPVYLTHAHRTEPHKPILLASPALAVIRNVGSPWLLSLEEDAWVEMEGAEFEFGAMILA